ncbi:MAG: 4Fe-4S dicluster domain-containing protein [Candidatus Bathyarchaeia archaeon]
MKSQGMDSKSDAYGTRFFISGDPDRCRGCGCCELICSLIHEGECNPSTSRIVVKKDFFQLKFEPETCRQCPEHPCLSACPVGAIRVDPKTGAKVLEDSLCVGCGLCARACPFNLDGYILRFHPGRKVYLKCDLCGGNPACVEYCPREALKLVPWKADSEFRVQR